MPTSPETDRLPPRALGVSFTNTTFTVALDDGRHMIVPLWWYPRLQRATRTQRNNWTLLGSGIVITWPDIDEHIEVAHLLAGHKSVELKQIAAA